jgi:hypothetical protein
MHLGKSMKPLNKIEKILIEVQGFRFSAHQPSQAHTAERSCGGEELSHPM